MLRHYAELRICHFRSPGLSADDRRMAVLKAAFGAKNALQSNVSANHIRHEYNTDNRTSAATQHSVRYLPDNVAGKTNCSLPTK